MTRAVAFNTFIEFLKGKKIKYALLGDTRNYPEEIGSDIDFIIDKKSYLKIENIIQEFCLKYKFFLIQKIEHERNAAQFVITHFNEDNNIYLQLDICYDYTRSGRDYLKGYELLNNVVPSTNGNFSVLAPAYAFIYYFMKKIEKGSLNSSQFEYLKYEYNKDRVGTEEVLRNTFSTFSVGEIVKIFTADNYQLLELPVAKFQKELFTAKPKSITSRIGEIARKCKRIIKPTGLVIGILGRDGTGKSTLINHLEVEMESIFPQIKYYHLYPGLFLNNKKNEDSSNPHKKKTRSGVSSLLKLGFFYFEYTLGFWYKLYPQKVKSTLVIMDRYFIDMYADPDRYRNSTSKHLVWFIHKLLPKPDLWIILDASTEAVFKRKQEVEYAVCEAQRKKYLELAEKLKNASVLDTEKDIKEEVLLAVEIIRKKLTSKFI
jgi:thymidylate kinase